MGILDRLKELLAPDPAHAGDETDTVHRIARQLDDMPADRARRVAAYAYVLSRVANADSEISAVESQEMERLVCRYGRLLEPQAALVVEIAKSQNRLFGGTENYIVTREFRELATREERAELLRCLFAVSAADDSISAEETAQIRLIADELGFSHEEYVAIRAEFSGSREVLRGLPRGHDPAS